MKKFLSLVTIIILLTINVNVLKADCEQDKEDAKYISYFTNPIIQDDKINIYTDLYGIKENMYVTVYDSISKETKTYNYGDENFEYGALYIRSWDVNEKIEYVIKVYSNLCEKDEVLNTIEISHDKVNKYAYSDICKENDNVYKSEWCEPYKDTSNMSEKEIEKKIKQDAKSFDFKYNVKIIVKKYYLFVLIPVLLISIFYIVRIILIKRNKKKQVM